MVNAKETTVDKLNDNLEKGDFVIRLDELYSHLDSLPDWQHVSHLIRAIRLKAEEVRDEGLVKIAEEVHEDPENDFNQYHFDHRARDRELYMYLIKKIYVFKQNIGQSLLEPRADLKYSGW